MTTPGDEDPEQDALTAETETSRGGDDAEDGNDQDELACALRDIEKIHESGLQLHDVA